MVKPKSMCSEQLRNWQGYSQMIIISHSHNCEQIRIRVPVNVNRPHWIASIIFLSGTRSQTTLQSQTYPEGDMEAQWSLPGPISGLGAPRYASAKEL